MGFESYSNGSGPDSGNWSKRKEVRVGAGLEGDSWGRRESTGSGSGRPRLSLQPRTLPVVTSNNNIASGGLSVTPTEAKEKEKGATRSGRPGPGRRCWRRKGRIGRRLMRNWRLSRLKRWRMLTRLKGLGGEGVLGLAGLTLEMKRLLKVGGSPIPLMLLLLLPTQVWMQQRIAPIQLRVVPRLGRKSQKKIEGHHQPWISKMENGSVFLLRVNFNSCRS